MRNLEGNRAGGLLIFRASLTHSDQRTVRGCRFCKVATYVIEILCIAFLAGSALVTSGLAQVAALPQPQVTLTDGNNVDLLSEELYLQQNVISIGSADHPLTDTIYSQPDGDWFDDSSQIRAAEYFTIDSFSPSGIEPISVVGYTVGSMVFLGHQSEYFCEGTVCSTPTAVEPTGSQLTTNSSGAPVYIERDGTQVTFGGSTNGDGLTLPSQIQYPDGRVLTFTYASGLLESVTRSDGMQLVFNYGTIPSGGRQGDTALVSITAINNAYEYCNPAAISTCSLTGWPTAYLSWSTPASGVGLILTVTDSAGRVTTYTEDGNWHTVGIQLPSSTEGNNIAYTYCNTGCTNVSTYAVENVTQDGYAWTYNGTITPGSLSQCGNATYESTSPAGGVKTISMYSCANSVQDPYEPSNHIMDPLISLTNEQGETFNADSDGFEIVSEQMLEGNQNQYTWDPRGNLTQVIEVPKSGSTVPSITLSANYDGTCSNALTCNEPNSITDGNGYTTSYTYNPNNGKLATVTLPADANGVNPQINYTYVQQYAWVLNASGSYVESAPIWVLYTESYCQTSAATSSGGCTATNDQVVKTFYYGPNSGPNNLFLRGAAVTANGQTRVTCYGYDKFGNRISVTTPNAGLSLTSCDQFTQN